MCRETSKVMWQLQVESPSLWHGNAEVFQHAVSELLPVIKKAEKDVIVPDGEGTLTVYIPPLAPPLRGTLTLLQGLAIENQVKAILMILCPNRFVKAEELTKEFVTHNLQDLIRIVNELRPNTISLKNRAQLLEKLDSTVVWAKYGVPKTVNKFHETRKQATLLPVVPKGGYPLTGHEIKASEKLYNELELIYRSFVEPKK